MRRCLPVSLLLLLCSAHAVAAQVGGGTSVTGVIEVLWGDPPSPNEPPVLRIMLAEDNGNLHQLELDDALLTTHGGIVGLNRRRVTVQTGALSPVRPREDEPLHVTGLRLDPLDVAFAADPRAAAAIAPAMSSSVVSVSRPYVTILCRFGDSPTITPYPKEHFETVMGAAYPGVNHYWTEVTENRINLNGSVVLGWYTLPSPRADYFNTNGDAILSKLATDCTGVADADVNFPQYSGINLQFNQRLDCCSWGGSRTMTLDGVTRTYPMTWEADWAAAQIGTYAHEVGHSLGLPHSGGPYGRVYDSRWDVMSSSSWVPVSGTPYRVGTHTNGYHKNLLGAVPPERRVVATEVLTTARLERSAQPRANGNAQLIQIPLIATTPILYTVEARRRAGYDAAVPNEGVVIHQVAPGRGEPAQVVDADGNGNPNDAGAIWTVGETFHDLAHGIIISVDSLLDDAFVVTVRRNAFAAMSVTPPFRTRALATGPTIGAQDSARVTGPAVAWQAVTRSRRLRITTPTGTGTAMLRWHSELAGLSPGLYVDTIRIITAASAWPALVIDSLQLTAPAAAALRLSVSATSRADSLVTQRTGFVDSVRIQLEGPGAASATWSATRSLTGTIISTTAGTGPGAVRWYHTAVGRAPGTYVDTIRITTTGAAGSPLLIVDTLRVYDTPVITVTRGATRTTVLEGSPLENDSALVQLSGRWAEAGVWNVASVRATSQRFLRPTSSSHTGSGALRFTRGPGSRAPGTYIDSLRLTPAMVGTAGAVYVVDTLVVEAAPLAFSLSWQSRRDSVFQSMAPSADSVLVLVHGPGASAMGWQSTATSRITLASRDAFTSVGAGTGSQWLRWLRNIGSRPPGVYVDTITVTLTGTQLSARLVDSLVILQPRVNIVARASLRDAIMGAAYNDTLRASSGVGAVTWSLASGVLPRGVALDTLRGTVAGIPEQAGDFHVDIRARAGTADTLVTTTLRVTKPVLTDGDVLDHLLGIRQLTADHVRFLDLLGNRNSRVDVGDVRAWLQDAGRVPANSVLQHMLETQPQTSSSRGGGERRQP